MRHLREKILDESAFLCGVELVTTRGTLAEGKAIRLREFASDLVHCQGVDWVSITDNAGGNPMLAPMALGTPILYAGKEVMIHLSCKDFNRNGLEREAWQLASEGFHNILTLSGDYPATGFRGRSKPVFDLDSIGLLALLGEMNRGLAGSAKKTESGKRLGRTDFFLGAVTTNFKLHEGEVMPQYFKLLKKLEVGAQFIISQIGYDSRKCHELKAYLTLHNYGHVPIIGNVFLLSPPVARFFHSQKIPGVVVSDELLALCERHSGGADGGRAFFLELAAKQVAIFRGLGYRGVYLGGVSTAADTEKILEIEATWGPTDWRTFAREIRFSRPGEFYYFAEDPSTGLADPGRLNPEYEASLNVRASGNGSRPMYSLSRGVHDAAFTPGSWAFRLGQKIYSRASNKAQGPKLLRVLEHVSKSVLFGCKDCGDCSLPETAFLCPESQCAKNQRNGPCGGTRDGKCEVAEFECIWSRAYHRLKQDGSETTLLDHAPVIQDQALRGTSSWANTFLGRDHQATGTKPVQERNGSEEQPVIQKDETHEFDRAESSRKWTDGAPGEEPPASI